MIFDAIDYKEVVAFYYNVVDAQIEGFGMNQMIFVITDENSGSCNLPNQATIEASAPNPPSLLMHPPSHTLPTLIPLVFHPQVVIAIPVSTTVVAKVVVVLGPVVEGATTITTSIYIQSLHRGLLGDPGSIPPHGL